MTKEIQLTQGKVTLVDDEDYEWLSQWKWCAKDGRNGNFYAFRASKNKSTYMHRLILDTPKGKVTDHINGNGLDNRRINLRICSYRENSHNKNRANSMKITITKGHMNEIVQDGLKIWFRNPITVYNVSETSTESGIKFKIEMKGNKEINKNQKENENELP